MWEFLTRQLLKEAGRKTGGRFFNDEANGPEVYADRIKRDFRLDDYADARTLYDSDRAYWERYYSTPPDPDWKKVIVRDSVAAAGVPSRSNVFEYGFPESSSAQPSMREAVPVRRSITQAPEKEARSNLPIGGAPIKQYGGGAMASALKAEGPLTLMDAYLEYKKRMNAYQSQTSAVDPIVRTAPLDPSGNADFSGGVISQLAARAGIDPQNLNQLAPSQIGTNSAPRLVRVSGNNVPAPAFEPNLPVMPLALPGSLESSRGVADRIATLAGLDLKNPTRPAPSALDEMLLGLVSGSRPIAQ